MADLAGTLAEMKKSPQNIRYEQLYSLCVMFFGEPRQKGTSHAVFKTPWFGDPRVNIQRGAGGKAKPYQVRQVLAALDRIKEADNE